MRAAAAAAASRFALRHGFEIVDCCRRPARRLIDEGERQQSGEEKNDEKAGEQRAAGRDAADHNAEGERKADCLK